MKKGVLGIILIVFIISPSYGQERISGSLEQIGTSMANFLKIGVGARALAMGDAYVALSDDISSLYWNPGALDRMPTNQIIVQQTNWLVDTKIYYLGAGYKWNNVGAIGVSAHFFSSGDIEETTLRQPEGTGRTFTAEDFSLGLTFSRMITNRFSTGVTVKIIQESLAKETASAVAVDIGSVFETNFLNNLRIGMALSNLGGEMKLSGSDLSVQYATNPDYPTKVIRANLATESWDIPLFFRFGVATEIMKNEAYHWTVSTEVMDSRDFIHRLAVGTELGFKQTVFLRGGYKFNYDEESFSVGCGLNYKLSGMQLKLDYAYGKFGVFDNTQRFSFIFGF
ncbi:PorV/PorQ family protein, partial [candidate division KSB1 bacterium]|nr:PorV/PorQ family protein [candidate division KSB1 bacterium]